MFANGMIMLHVHSVSSQGWCNGNSLEAGLLSLTHCPETGNDAFVVIVDPLCLGKWQSQRSQYIQNDVPLPPRTNSVFVGQNIFKIPIAGF